MGGHTHVAKSAQQGGSQQTRHTRHFHSPGRHVPVGADYRIVLVAKVFADAG